MNAEEEHPVRINFNKSMIFLFLLFGGMYFAKEFLAPVCYAACLSMLMLPGCRWMEKKGLGKTTSAFMSIMIIVVVIAFMIFILSAQFVSFTSELPVLKVQLFAFLDHIQSYIEQKTNIAPEKQIDFMKSRSGLLIESAGTYATSAVITTTSAIINFVLISFYIFFFLYYREKFYHFILKQIPVSNHERAKKTINEITHVTTNYITGMLIVILLLGIMNMVGFLIIDVPHAIFFAFLGAFLNIIPYIGVWIGSLLPLLMVMITKNSIGPGIAVAIVVAIAQFIEGNFLTPKITGSRVKINPLATIVAIIIGSLIWGMAGAILFIPLLGIMKVIFDNVPGYESYSYLIGDDENNSDHTPWYQKLKKVFGKRK